jgi:hypothetical protein
MPNKYDEYCEVAMDKMWEQSIPHPDDEEESVWSGGLIHYIEGLFMPTKVNGGKITAMLQQSGAIHQLVRGGGPTPSVYHLRRRHYATNDDGMSVDVSKADPYYSTTTERREKQYLGLNNRLHKLEQFIPMLLEIALERAGDPSVAEQIADVYEEETKKSIAEQLGVPDYNSTQEHP